ncbi:fanconi-associated nuclease 1 homolog isoform X1 [Populus nigra]|uniref:fanconi-associated nuclease 1 homolog isoform X1 n=2 Tax=Populus nigra TaxID=3691 RepID=UPI002B274F99|nr:fanconi-associated nuclease 1 homolog isoform X1 [Populus nigra]
MLRGRESLIRLVGKRRRFLPNRKSLLSDSTSIISNSHPPQTPLNLGKTDENEDGIIMSMESEQKSKSPQSSDSVTCPVCSSKLAAQDHIINSHLDACLTRGTKRKLTQRTLFQLNFCSQPMVCSRSSDVKKLGTGNVQEDAAVGFDNSTAVDENEGNLGTLVPMGEAVLGISMDGSPMKQKLIDDDGINSRVDSSLLNLRSEVTKCIEAITVDDISGETALGTSAGGSTMKQKLIDDDRINGQVDPSLLSLRSEVMKSIEAVPVGDISGVFLETFIVGRRFSVEKELNLGANICLLRETDNAKDPNAIQVLLADSRCCKVLGYLPRELAQYLSPLIDKYSLTFKGCITSVPKHYLDVVPIQIECCEVMLESNKDHTEIEDFTCSWKNVLHVAESAKNYPPSMTKYQQNFWVLIQEVLKSNPHLFTNDEKMFLESFISLSDDSQRLFVRLYTRKGPWFRMSNISYPEVTDSQQAIMDLSAMGYMCSFKGVDELQENDMEKILNLLTVSELREIASMSKNGTRVTRKQDLIASVFSSYEDGVCPFLPIAILDRTGICIKISSKAESLIWRAERLFFLNGEQDLSAFLLVDLGIIKYPAYHCIISEQIFSARSDVIAYEEAIEVAQMMDESLDENKSESVLRCIKIAESRMSHTKASHSTASELVTAFFSCFSASWVYSKVLFLGVSFLERERRYMDAINLLKRLLFIFTCDGRRGNWTLRLSIDLEHVGCPNESLLVAEDGLLDPWVRAGSRMALQRRVLRLGKPPRRWKAPSFSLFIKRKIREVHIQGRPLNCEAGIKSRFYGEDGAQCGVEQLALQYYAGQGGGWQGVHTESGIWLTIFALLMWDIIFSDLPNVFRNRFQTAPLDLETDNFYPARKSLIESQLQKIYDGTAEMILITSWELHSGTACRGVNWDRHSLPELRAAVTCVGGPCLASLCRHLAQDYRSWSSGMPDLLLWRFHGEYKGEAKLVEVKGPRDCLSEQQRAWLLLLMDCGFNTEVCKVSIMPLST